MRVATILSYRLGGTDGVAIEAVKLQWALEQLGYSVRRVAGDLADGARGDDVVVPSLSMDADAPPRGDDIEGAIDGTDLLFVENVCSLPLRVEVSRAVSAAAEQYAARGGRAVLHHHDLPWQRRHLRELEAEFPPRIADVLHLTINLRSRRELVARRYESVATIHNHFDLDAPAGDRDGTRAQLGFEPDDIVLFQPARAIERKNVPGGVRFANALHQRLTRVAPNRRVRYWLTGPAEDGYGPTLERVLAKCEVPITFGRAPTPADGYAASDVVLFPSTWEGFGNPVIESIGARRPLVVFPYPVLAEIVACGLEFFSPDDVDEVVRFVARPDTAYLERQLRRARLNFSLTELPSALAAVFAEMGWPA